MVTPIPAGPSAQAVRSEYIYRVLTNFLDLLTDEDREFLSRYWGGLQQITEDLYLQGYQNDLSKNIFTVPVFRRSRWNEIILNYQAEPAKLLSTKTGTSFDTSTGTGDNTITILVDGNPVLVTFTDTATNLIANVVLEINNQVALVIPGLIFGVASIENNRIVLQSADIGNTATIAIDSVDGNIPLGFYPGVSAVGSGISTRAEPAQLTGSVSSPIFDTSVGGGSNTLKINLNQTGELTVTFNDDVSSTIIAVKNAINAVFPSLASISIDNKIVLTSNITGAQSSLVITPGGGNASLGFTAGDLSFGCGDVINNPIPERPVSYEIRIGTSDDSLNLVPLTDPAVVSIPALRNRIDGPDLLFGQSDKPHLGRIDPETNFGTGLDPLAVTVSDAYLISDGRIHFSKAIESQIRSDCLNILWAEDVFRNDTYLKDNFGFPIQVERDNSIEYKNVLQGLHHAYWSGPNIRNTEVGMSLLFGLPTAPITGRIESISISSNPEIVGTEASDFFDVRDSNRTFAFTIDGVFVFTIFDPTNAYPATGPSPSHENYPASFVRDDINAAAAAASLPFPNPADLLQPTPGVFQIRLKGLNSIRIDTITGNISLGFAPGIVSFGENEIVIGGQTFQLSTEFPITKNPGDFVERLDPLTDGVEILHYITDPIWWEVFGVSTLDSQFNLVDGYSQSDLDIINNILKYHVFGVKVVPDAFNRLGDIELGIVSKFINDIKPLTKNFLFIIPFALLDVFAVTDDPALDGFPDYNKFIQMIIPHNLEYSLWSQIGTNANAGIHVDSTSFNAANGGITRAAVVGGTFAGDTSGFDLDSEVVYASNGGQVIVLDSSSFGAPPQRYFPALVTSAISGPYDTTTWPNPVIIAFNGSTVSFFVGGAPDEIPLGTSVPIGDIANGMNTKLASSAVSGLGFIGASTDNRLRIISHKYNGATPTIILITNDPVLGFDAIPFPNNGLPGILSQSIDF
jgi:hypothetical protein